MPQLSPFSKGLGGLLQVFKSYFPFLCFYHDKTGLLEKLYPPSHKTADVSRDSLRDKKRDIE